MDRKVRVVQFGCGRMGSICMKNAAAKGAEIVGAFDANPAVVGMDIAERMNAEKETGVKISPASEFDKMLPELNADIVIVTTLSLIKDVFDALLTCAKHGVNAITSCEEAIYPWNSSPKLVAMIDEEAKKNNCTICGSGAQELQWGSTIVNVASGMDNVTKIVIENINDSELYGYGFARSYGVGCSQEEFDNEIAGPFELSEEETQKSIENGTFVPGFFWNSNEWLARKLGWTVSRQTQKIEPVYAEKDLYSEVLEKTVKKGEICGGKQIAMTETEEGIIIEGSNIATIHEEGVPEACNFSIFNGEAELRVEEPAPPIPVITCATLVNRIPTVINSKPGYVTTDEQDDCVYMTKSMEYYVK